MIILYGMMYGRYIPGTCINGKSRLTSLVWGALLALYTTGHAAGHASLDHEQMIINHLGDIEQNGICTYRPCIKL